MAMSKEEAMKKARQDVARRLDIEERDIQTVSVKDAEFPDMALGAPVSDEMSGQMITPGWRITLEADGQTFEYRANRNQLRLWNYKGGNYLI
jgi:hypothetical protein